MVGIINPMKKSTKQTIEQLESLPETLRSEVRDFIALLRSKYLSLKITEKQKAGSLSEEAFVGIWKDHKEFRDSVFWVRENRRSPGAASEWFRS